MFARMLDKSQRPSAEEMALYCGENGDRFRRLNEELSARFSTEQEIRFPYGNHYGWCVTHRKKKKLVCDIFAEAGAFTVMLRLSDQQYAAVYEELTAYTKAYIDGRYPCGDGGWIPVRVRSEEHLQDIRILLNEKCR